MPGYSGMLGSAAVASAVTGAADAVPIADTATPVASGAPQGKQASGVSVASSGGDLPGRSIMYISIGYIIVAALILGVGARLFRDARIA